jgi:hypothetical protein
VLAAPGVICFSEVGQSERSSSARALGSVQRWREWGTRPPSQRWTVLGVDAGDVAQLLDAELGLGHRCAQPFVHVAVFPV